jgi:hypothetical protein
VSNEKYDNLTALMVNGAFNWASNDIRAVLVTGASFDATDVVLGDLLAPQLGMVPVPRRAITPQGAMLGWPVSFNRVPKNTPLQVVLIKTDGVTISLLAYFDRDQDDKPLTLKTQGTFILRPTPLDVPLVDPTGVWIQI